MSDRIDNTASQMFGVPVSQVTPEQRQRAQAVIDNWVVLDCCTRGIGCAMTANRKEGRVPDRQLTQDELDKWIDEFLENEERPRRRLGLIHWFLAVWFLIVLLVAWGLV